MNMHKEIRRQLHEKSCRKCSQRQVQDGIPTMHAVALNGSSPEVVHMSERRMMASCAASREASVPHS